MSTIKLPGFTAEMSLYKADHYRQVVASSARRLKGQVVVPQGSGTSSGKSELSIYYIVLCA